MNDTTVMPVQAKWLDRLPPLRLASCCGISTAAMLLFFAPVAAIAYMLRGPAALPAAGVAAGVCWLSSLAALAGTARFGRRGPNAPMFTLLFGMVFNCAVPFAAGLVLSRTSAALAQAGVFGLMVIFFQFALVVTTLLTLCLVKPPRAGQHTLGNRQ
ncbi:MAG TPA: hypothetical protein VHV08_13045 [Pirellulales bacterium]|jgi:hypothetical protein|nr:hypothetical protein [Pirellulales bacterium]